MTISKKWQAVAAGAIAIALIGAGATSANAAPGDPLNPQPSTQENPLSKAPGSKGGFFLFDGNTGEPADSNGTRVYAKDETIIGSASATNVDAEINPAATRPVSGATTFTGVYAFLAEKNETDVMGGLNTWNAYHVDAAAGPNGGTLQPSLTLQSFVSGPGGIADDIAAGGTYWYGIAYTNLQGVQVVAAVYREITIEAGTGNYTVTPSILEGAAAADLIVESELVSPETAPVTTATDSKQVSINAGAAHANQTLNAAAFANGTRVELGSVTLDANGVGNVNATAIPVNVASKLFLYSLDVNDNEILAGWGAFTLTQSQTTTDTTDLSVEVTNSGKFSIVAPAATSIDLGDVRRNRVSAPVALGSVTVFDDRDVLSGWNLNVSATAFTGPGATTVPATALGYAPTGTALFPGITAGAAKSAGEGAFGVLAEGAAGSATGEFDGAVIDTNLTFKAPINAAKGVHTATLTLDLVSK